MAHKNNLLKNLNKLVDIIPDTTKIIGDTVQAAAPIVDKALDRQHEKNLSQIQVPNVIDLDAEEAKRHLEEIGFRTPVPVEGFTERMFVDGFHHIAKIHIELSGNQYGG